MTIGGRPFLSVDIDFTGKNGTKERADHLSDIALILENEYRHESLTGGGAEFYYEVFSRMDYLQITDFDLKELEYKIKAKQFLKYQNQTNGQER